MVLIKPESACVAPSIPFHCIRGLSHHPLWHGSATAAPQWRPHRRSSPSTFILPRRHRTRGQRFSPKRPERRGRLRRKVISAVSPQRFPHSTVISSNNVSQSFQLLRRMGAERRHAGATRWLGFRPPAPTLFAPLIFLSTVLASQVMLT